MLRGSTGSGSGVGELHEARAQAGSGAVEPVGDMRAREAAAAAARLLRRKVAGRSRGGGGDGGGAPGVASVQHAHGVLGGLLVQGHQV